jgi:hypothetical protein
MENITDPSVILMTFTGLCHIILLYQHANNLQMTYRAKANEEQDFVSIHNRRNNLV